MKRSLQNKLKAYSALSAVAVVAASDVDAQVVTSTVNFVGGYESYDIDLDGDGSTNFTIVNQQLTSSIQGFFGSSADGGLMGISAPDGFFAGSVFPYNLAGYGIYTWGSSFDSLFASYNPAGAVIGSYFPDWSATSAGILAGVANLATYDPVYAYPFWGNFAGSQDALVGLRISSDAGNHYGWARLDVATSGEKFLVKDYGFESQAGVIVYAPQSGNDNPYYASDYVYLGVSDGGNSLDASDIRIKLTTNQAADYFGNIDDYHVVLSKVSNGELSVQDALAAPGVTVVEDGSNDYMLSYETFDVDSDGDLIEQGVEYSVYVVVRDFAGRPMRMVSRSITLKNTLGVEELSSDEVKISGANKHITVRTGSALTNATVTVHDIMGRVVLTDNITSNLYTNQLNVTEGIYIVTVASKDGKITKKVKL